MRSSRKVTPEKENKKNVPPPRKGGKGREGRITFISFAMKKWGEKGPLVAQGKKKTRTRASMKLEERSIPSFHKGREKEVNIRVGKKEEKKGSLYLLNQKKKGWQSRGGESALGFKHEGGGTVREGGGGWGGILHYQSLRGKGGGRLAPVLSRWGPSSTTEPCFNP